MNAPDLDNVRWKKSSRSSGNGQCVMTALVPNGVAVADSKDMTGPALAFDPVAWTAFTTGIKGGKITA